jgi:hypothetical protein
MGLHNLFLRIGNLSLAIPSAAAIFSGMKSPRKKPTATKLKRWRISIMRARGQHIGTVEAESREAAEASAIKTFNLTEEQRRGLAILEHE